MLARRFLSAISDIRKALQDQTDAISEATRAANEKQNVPPEVVAELRLPHGIETHKSAADASGERRYQRWTLLVAILTLGVITTYTRVAYFQWREMISATGAAQDAVHEARLSRLQSQKVLNAQIDQFHLDQRAWVGVKALDAAPLEANKPVTAIVHFTNTGKTLAIHTVADVVIKPSPEKLDIARYAVSKDRPHPKSHSAMIMFPNIDATLPITTTENASTQDIQNIKDGKFFIYVFGEIHYTDIFQRAHITHYCGVLNPNVSPPSYNACDTYNDAD